MFAISIPHNNQYIHNPLTWKSSYLPCGVYSSNQFQAQYFRPVCHKCDVLQYTTHNHRLVPVPLTCIFTVFHNRQQTPTITNLDIFFTTTPIPSIIWNFNIHTLQQHYSASCDMLNPLNAELNPICYLLTLLGAHHFLHISRIRVKSLTLRLLISYIYIYIYIYIYETLVA